MTQKSYRLQEIAEALGASLRGGDPPDIRITGLATLQAAVPGQISFLANPSYAKYLKDTRASAVIVSSAAADDVPTNVLLLDNPYLAMLTSVIGLIRLPRLPPRAFIQLPWLMSLPVFLNLHP